VALGAGAQKNTQRAAFYDELVRLNSQRANAYTTAADHYRQNWQARG